MAEEHFEERIYGLRLTNSESLPEVTITKACVVKGYQSFVIETERETMQFAVTPKGYLRPSKPMRKKKVK